MVKGRYKKKIYLYVGNIRYNFLGVSFLNKMQMKSSSNISKGFVFRWNQ